MVASRLLLAKMVVLCCLYRLGSCINTVSKVQCHRTNGSKLRQSRKTHSIASCQPERRRRELEGERGHDAYGIIPLPFLFSFFLFFFSFCFSFSFLPSNAALQASPALSSGSWWSRKS